MGGEGVTPRGGGTHRPPHLHIDNHHITLKKKKKKKSSKFVYGPILITKKNCMNANIMKTQIFHQIIYLTCHFYVMEKFFMLHVPEEYEAFRNASRFFLIQCSFFLYFGIKVVLYEIGIYRRKR